MKGLFNLILLLVILNVGLTKNNQASQKTPYSMKRKCHETFLLSARKEIAQALKGVDQEFLSFESVSSRNYHTYPYGVFINLDFKELAKSMLKSEKIVDNKIINSVALHVKCHAIKKFESL